MMTNSPPARRRGRAAAVAVVLAAALGLAACGAGQPAADPTESQSVALDDDVLSPSSSGSPAVPAPTPASTPASSSGGAPSSPDLQQMVDSYQASQEFVGVSVAVVTPTPGQDLPLVRYFSAGSPMQNDPDAVTPATQYEIGSETKTFTGALLARLVAEGRVGLDDELQKYAPAGITVPSWTAPDGTVTPITLRNLATHQSGLPDMPANIEAGCPGGTLFCPQDRELYTRDMMWQGLAATPLAWQPGTNFLYSNFAFGILGTVLADLVAPGEQIPPYWAVLQQQIVSALSMPSTQLGGSSPQLAGPYTTAANGGWPTYYYNDTNAMAGEGGLISDATDMATWVAVALGYPVGQDPDVRQAVVDTLNPVSTITTHCTSPTDCTPDSFQMGLAWSLYPAGTKDVPVPWAWKNGGTAGMHTVTYLAPSKGVGVTVLTNGGKRTPEGFGLQLFQAVLAGS